MKIYHFKNSQAVSIGNVGPNRISSSLQVSGTGGTIQDVNVKLDLEHTFTSDLVITLSGPDGSSVELVHRTGGSGDNFSETTFDDDASTAISLASPPFAGTFSPHQALSAFDGKPANGTWTLEVNDLFSGDGGSLKEWELEIVTDEPSVNTGPFIFRNLTPQNISAGGPSVIESQIMVHGLDNQTVDTVLATIDVQHTFTNDLKISLKDPGGDEVFLVEGEGGGGDNYHNTTFNDAAPMTIAGAAAPFTGAFQPEGTLADFQGNSPNGQWTLRIEDQAFMDGGSLQSWSLEITTHQQPVPSRPFEIKVRFLGGLTPSQQAIFQQAADRWSEIITGNLPSVQTSIGVVDDVVIDARGMAIDGPFGVLGRAGPTVLRPGSHLPARGIMEFDSADLQRLENAGELIDVIIHEMGHVLGIGTLWSRLGLLNGSGTNNPEFNGTNAMTEYAALKGLANPTPVPVANTGGPGTAEGHWRESVFDTELMTGFDDPGRNALSRMTVASLQDLGYQVDITKADPFILPFNLLSTEAVEAKHSHQCNIEVPDFEVLPEDSIIT